MIRNLIVVLVLIGMCLTSTSCFLFYNIVGDAPADTYDHYKIIDPNLAFLYISLGQDITNDDIINILVKIFNDEGFNVNKKSSIDVVGQKKDLILTATIRFEGLRKEVKEKEILLIGHPVNHSWLAPINSDFINVEGEIKKSLGVSKYGTAPYY